MYDSSFVVNWTVDCSIQKVAVTRSSSVMQVAHCTVLTVFQLSNSCYPTTQSSPYKFACVWLVRSSDYCQITMISSYDYILGMYIFAV